jgi:hypothetical protein
MIFGKTALRLQRLHTRVTLSLWAFSRQGATGRGSPYSQHGILWQVRGESEYLETFRAGADPGSILSHLGLVPPRDRDLGRLDLGDGFWDGDYGWGVRVRRHFGAHGRSSVRYGIRLGDLKESWFILFSK